VQILQIGERQIMRFFARALKPAGWCAVRNKAQVRVHLIIPSMRCTLTNILLFSCWRLGYKLGLPPHCWLLPLLLGFVCLQGVKYLGVCGGHTARIYLRRVQVFMRRQARSRSHIHTRGPGTRAMYVYLYIEVGAGAVKVMLIKLHAPRKSGPKILSLQWRVNFVIITGAAIIIRRGAYAHANSSVSFRLGCDERAK